MSAKLFEPKDKWMNVLVWEWLKTKIGYKGTVIQIPNFCLIDLDRNIPTLTSKSKFLNLFWLGVKFKLALLRFNQLQSASAEMKLPCKTNLNYTVSELWTILSNLYHCKRDLLDWDSWSRKRGNVCLRRIRKGNYVFKLAQWSSN